MADIVKDSFDETNRFTKVLFQRGKDVIDFELNEAQDNLRVDSYTSAKAIGGDGSPDGGLKITGTGVANSVTVGAGVFIAHGYHITYAGGTFSTLTTNPGPGTRTDLIYAALSEAEVADPEVVADIGETTRRRQLSVVLGVAEGVAVPTDSVQNIWEGGTRYVTLASIERGAAVALIAASDVTDLRGKMPRLTLNESTERNTTSGRHKVIVQALNAETSTDPQLGVRAEAGALVFSADRSGNLTFTGTLTPGNTGSLIPSADNTYDIGSPTFEYRNGYFDGTLNVDLLVASVAASEGLGSHLYPATDNTYTLGSTARAYSEIHGRSIYAGTAFLPEVDDTTDIGAVGAEFRHGYFDGTLTTDLLVVSATASEGMASSLLPTATATYDIGSSARRFGAGYYGTVHATTSVYAGTSFLGTADDACDIGAPGVEFRNGYFDGTLTTDIFTLSTTAAEGLGSHLYPTADGTWDLGAVGREFKDGYFDGTLTTDILTLSTATAEGVGSHVFPTASATWDFGSSSRKFRHAYFSGNVDVDATLYADYLVLSASAGRGVNSHLYPTADNTHALGTTGRRWSNVVTAALTVDSLSVVGNFVPTTDDSTSLGEIATPKRWQHGYFSDRVWVGDYTPTRTFPGLYSGHEVSLTAGQSAAGYEAHIKLANVTSSPTNTYGAYINLERTGTTGTASGTYGTYTIFSASVAATLGTLTGHYVGEGVVGGATVSTFYGYRVGYDNTVTTTGYGAHLVVGANTSYGVYATVTAHTSTAYGANITAESTASVCYGVWATSTGATASCGYYTAVQSAADVGTGLYINGSAGVTGAYGIRAVNITASSGVAYGGRVVTVSGSSAYGHYVSGVTGTATAGSASGFYATTVSSSSGGAYGFYASGITAGHADGAVGLSLRTISNTAGSAYGAFIDSVSSTTADASGILVSAVSASTSAIGLYVGSVASSGSDVYGIRIANGGAAAGTKWAIHTSSGSGSVFIGSASIVMGLTAGTISLGSSGPVVRYGSGVPSAADSNGSFYINTNPSSASTVLYVRYGGAWTALTVP